ncbi:hypothetical protein OSB04_005881 [Centaurea solstitialis]|uniref:TTF-type domain-containing protein n=1 Tax=Centaurea solstitialis TaxID=347529 RepID=A0AA38WSC6_9ASTR|nr:hypothetical protein OSB04_005881 [Centaurea solstitialis]
MEKFLKRKASTSEPNSGEYHPNQIDEIRRKYLIRGPCQPRGHTFPKNTIGRRFSPTWFDQFGNWLEYSIKADKVFCLCCYLFRDQFGGQGGSDAFVTEGFNGWHKKERLSIHVGDVNSFHNKALKKSEDLMRQNQSIASAFHKQTNIAKTEYRIRLNVSIDVARHLLNGELAFRGHDESEKSFYRRHFLETIKLIRSRDETVRNVTLENAPGNNKMVAPDIQKDIVYCFAQEILKCIFEEIGDDVFALLVDESSDVSKKEQMVVVLRYVTCGIVKERLVGLVHVKETSSLYLKTAIESLFAEYGLSLKKVRGQGYDGASNMRGRFNGLKTLIMNENSSAYYVHCFAHQLQLVVVAVARKHHGAVNFFEMIDVLRKSKRKVEKLIGSGEVETGSGLNQELSLARAGDTRWGSHYKTLLRLVDLFPCVMEVLQYIEDDCENSTSVCQARGLQIYLTSFDFVFYLHLMLRILGVTNSLSQALQKRDQDILNAMSLVQSTKEELQEFRVDGFDSLLEKVTSFCEKHDIEMVNMKEDYVNTKNRRQKTNITYRHYYEYDCFNTVVDMQIQEFGDRFGEISSELLVCIAALNPHDSFCDFNQIKLLRLSELYPDDFSSEERIALEQELRLYIRNVHQDEKFTNLKGISDLAKVMVETNKHLTFPLVYRLLKLALVLPVATATVERCFSAMKIVKSDLRNRIGDDFLNACVICVVEREALAKVTNEDVINRFQKMKTRREQL